MILPVTLPIWLIGDGVERIPRVGNRVSYQLAISRATDQLHSEMKVVLKGQLSSYDPSGHVLPNDRSIAYFSHFDCLCSFGVEGSGQFEGEAVEISGRLFINSWSPIEGLAPLVGSVVEIKSIFELRGPEYRGVNPRQFLLEEYSENEIHALRVYPDQNQITKALVGVLLRISTDEY